MNDQELHPEGVMPPPKADRGLRIAIVVGIVIVALAGILIWVFVRRGAPNAEKGVFRAEDMPRPQTDPFPNDHDRDGLTNEQETAMGTSQTEFDTDHDGLSDIDEIEHWKTDPKNPDTDGDGFLDGLEVARGFNPSGPGGSAQ